MINLFTGATGTGKSAYCMSELLGLIEQGRPLFVHGIPELKIPHTLVVCDNPLCLVCPIPPLEPFEPGKPSHDSHDIELKQYAIDLFNYKKNQSIYEKKLTEYNKILRADEWHLWAPHGALIIYDEVHYVYPPTSSSAKKKPSVTLFSTHRHMGLDFYMMTQSPLLFDRSVKLLVGKHIHLKSTWAGRYQFEYSEVNDTVKNTSGAVKSKYSLNKKVFDLYLSSSLHTKQTRKIPAALYILVFLVVCVIGLGYRIKNRADSVINPVQASSEIRTQGTILKHDPNFIPEIIEEERVLSRSLVSDWASVGIKQDEFELIPAFCQIRKKVVMCPPLSLPPEFTNALTINKMCIHKGCFFYFDIHVPVQINQYSPPPSIQSY